MSLDTFVCMDGAVFCCSVDDSRYFNTTVGPAVASKLMSINNNNNQIYIVSYGRNFRDAVRIQFRC